jgi:hypothetical protein
LVTCSDAQGRVLQGGTSSLIGSEYNLVPVKAMFAFNQR